MRIRHVGSHRPGVGLHPAGNAAGYLDRADRLHERRRPAYRQPLESLRPVFWLESLALWAFGISWFVKSWPWKDEASYDLVEQ